MPLPGLARDVVVVSRAAGGTDAEGNANGALSVVLTTRGSWGSPSYRDRLNAQQRGQEIDATLSTATADIRINDLVNVRSKNYSVVAVGDSQLHMRLYLRLTE